MSKLGILYSMSFAAHGALAFSLAFLKEPKRTETIAITVSEGPKKKPEAARVVDTPKPDIAPADAPRPRAKAKVTPDAATKAEAPKPSALAPTTAATGGLDGLPDFGLTLGNGGPGGLSIPQGAGPVAAAAPSATAVARAPKILGPRPDSNECSDPLVKPKPKSIAQPAYTSSAREANVEGKVRVEVTVDDGGHVTAARLLAGLGYGLDEAAIDAAKRASFEPATRCGKPVGATFVIAMRFSL